MATTFPPPPTYAEPTVVDEKTGKAQFNPIWLKWFIDVAQILTQIGGTASAGNHNSLKGLQGGDGTSFIHLSSFDYINRMVNPMSAQGDLIVGGSSGFPTPLTAGSAGTKLTVISPGVLGWV